jgi:mono/diheme cytochrome c family protein
MRVPSSRVVLAFASLSLAAAVVACNQSEPTPAPGESTEQASAATAESQIRRGELLIFGGGCHDCHTPKLMTPAGPEADMSRSLSGHPESQTITAPFKGDAGPWTTHVNDHLTAWSGAWGVSFAANLTPDENTGIGIWTEEMFVNALKLGKHMGTSRQILPPMPWNYYGQLPEEDLKAMYAYLKSIPAVANRVPVPLGPDGKPIEEP